MEYIEFFIFCTLAFGIPISIVLLKLQHNKKKINIKSVLESGIPQKERITNRHKNTFYPIALMMVFTFVPLLLLIPVSLMRKNGDLFVQELITALAILMSTFLGYMIFKISGGLRDND